ncbi:MAG: diacylglyceryl transferase [Bacteroidetes bacterium]|nr:diacylglyceryl transferase [Bacteroidota bacterium]
MFPNFYFLFKDLFGIEACALVYINTFGFFVAISFLLANLTMTWELQRKEKDGLIKGMPGKQWVGVMPNMSDYAWNAAMGFILGWKFLYLIVNACDFFSDPQSKILSSEGSLTMGLIAAAIAVGMKYYQGWKTKNKHTEAKLEAVTIHPYQRMGNFTIIAAVAGLLGAKIFDHMEHWDEFIKNPLGAFLNPFSGLTFYGGLIVGGGAVLWYARKVNIHWRHMLDVGGPAMMLAYGVGRIGCHMAGDGDWGIVNTRPNPGWLPDWLWAYTYPNNVAHVCDPIGGVPCEPGVIPQLSVPVWPTPIYEAMMGIGLFFILWSLRKRIKVPGVLFCIYLIFAGFERFWIEKIRVNAVYHIGGMNITQAEIISVVLMIVGAIGWWWFKKHPEVKLLSSASGSDIGSTPAETAQSEEK